MTWVVAAAYPILGIVMSDVRISVEVDGRLVEVQKAGLRKVRLFSPITAAGFSAADVTRAWGALDSLERYLQANGEDAPLTEQLEEWVAGDRLAREPGARTEVLVLRARMSTKDTGEPFIPVVGGCHVRLADTEKAQTSVTPFGGVRHVGSGSEVARYAAAVEAAQEETIGLVNFYLHMGQGLRMEPGARGTAVARMVAYA